jgi:DNA repair photolyase
MIREIQAKTLLSSVRGEDPVFRMKYNMNIYRGCEHQCIYCDSRSECYGIEDFRDVLVKVNAVELLKIELPKKRIIGAIGTGSMSDPYTPAEKRYNLTGQALQVIAQHGFPLHMITKSDMVLKDIETLVEINQAQAVVCFTITTTDDGLARKLEPGAPLPSARLKAMQALASRGILVGTALMPVLPFIEDSWENLVNVAEQTAVHGGTFLLPWLGMSLRDRQREYFYTRLDQTFPGLRQRYEHAYGQQYSCAIPHARELYPRLNDLCQRLGLSAHMPYFEPIPNTRQLSLF